MSLVAGYIIYDRENERYMRRRSWIVRVSGLEVPTLLQATKILKPKNGVSNRPRTGDYLRGLHRARGGGPFK